MAVFLIDYLGQFQYRSIKLGTHLFLYILKNSKASEFSSGVYFYRIKVSNLSTSSHNGQA
jgi:hypothetical protein